MIRTYGKSPYTVAIVHGGPGDMGSVAPVAFKLSRITGTLEPIQSRHKVKELITELYEQIKSETHNPVTLIGHSWGAWLCAMAAAQYPEVAAKLVLVGSGPLESSYAKLINKKREEKYGGESFIVKKTVDDIVNEENNPENPGIFSLVESLSELSDITEITDNYDAEPPAPNDFFADAQMLKDVWAEAAELRSSGKLMDYMKTVQCPLYVIHGENDPHPWQGITEPLKKAEIPFKSWILPKCGHNPFREKYAKDDFYRILEEIITGKA